MDAISQPLYTAILEGNVEAAEESTRAAIEAGENPSRLLDETK